MPNRLVREGFLDSEAVHALSDAAECFFHRLLLAADDAGRIDGRAEILRARLFPLDGSRRASDVEKALSECQQQALVYPYEWDGRRFLQLTKWQRCSPCVTSKFPAADGTFRITYVKRETRDGEKEFVSTSLVMPKPLARDADGIGAVIPPMSGDVDVDGVEDGNDSVAPSRVSKQVELQTWIESLGGKDAIPADDPIFEYAEKTGIPIQYLELSWKRFVEDMTERKKRQVDWRKHYRNAVKGNWYKIWWFSPDGTCQLTTVGKQAERAAA